MGKKGDLFHHVCFSDESTFDILQNKAQFVRRRRGEKIHSDCVVQTVKHPTKIMIPSVISVKGTGRLYVVKGMMRQDQYKGVLQNRLIRQLEEWFPNGEPYILMQDGAACRTARPMKAFWENKISLRWIGGNCDENKTVVNTSLKSVPTSHDVNFRITHAFSHIGKGYSAIEKFCMVMNIDPFSSTTYGKCARRLDNAYTLASENIFAEIHREIKNVYENGAEIADLSVSFDGTWLTRGHTSLIGVGCVIDMLTGYVVDFEVMSKVCRHCSVAKNKLGQSSAEFSIWYEGHKSECDINHLGSSTSMEMEAALTLWKRSTSLGFRYITVLALRSTVKDCRAQGISSGGKAHGSLKEAAIKKLTTYYQKAILRNKGDVNAMKTAIYATLLHSISTDAKPQHSKCPAGENSWCFYQSAIANGENLTIIN
ncbi:uncharacterized protein TNCV_680941 [Trichonephila clavipes]|nr:uncharacterized protein TNCV_680941 [Trichonephila clavipes]